MIAPHELAEMRAAADRAPFDVQQKFHALLDAYEDTEAGAVNLREEVETFRILLSDIRELANRDS